MIITLFIGSLLGARSFIDASPLKPPNKLHEKGVVIRILQMRKPRLSDKARVKAQAKRPFFTHEFNIYLWAPAIC